MMLERTLRRRQRTFKQIATEGLRAALAARDAPFGDSRAKVTGPEIRDENGYLIPDSEESKKDF